jgi:hypothetical protein
MNPLSASDVFLTVTIMSVTFLIEVGLRNDLKGARDLGNAQPMRGLGLHKLDRWDRPSSIMTSDGNPKPVQFIQPSVLDRACLSVGKYDGFADQFGMLPHRTHPKFLTHGASPMALRAHGPSLLS